MHNAYEAARRLSVSSTSRVRRPYGGGGPPVRHHVCARHRHGAQQQAGDGVRVDGVVGHLANRLNHLHRGGVQNGGLMSTFHGPAQGA